MRRSICPQITTGDAIDRPGRCQANQLIAIAAPSLLVLIAADGDRAIICFLEFFADHMRNSHTRRAYGNPPHDWRAIFCWVIEHSID